MGPWKCLSFVLSLSLLGPVPAEKLRFDDHAVLRVVPETAEELLELRYFQDLHPELDFWSEPTRPNAGVDVRVSPEERAAVEDELRSLGFSIRVLIPNVQKLIDEQRVAPLGSKMAWEEYQQVDTIFEWLDSLPDLYPDTVTVESIGSSFEGRDVKLVRINRPGSTPKMSAFVENNIHAREWITSATITWIVNEILTNPDHDRILEEYDLHIVPITNPDGLEYTHTTSRMWRKTRSDYGEGCIGTDANRNWDFHWSDPGGSSSSPCSDLYRGPEPFSESETAAIRDYIIDQQSDGVEFKLFLSVHSFSQMILLPWSYTSDPLPDDFDQIENVGALTAEALERRHGTVYRYGNTVDLLYAVSGGSFDWGKGVAGIPMSLAFELRDTGEFAFLLPPDQIIPSGEETLDGIVALLDGTRETF